MVVLSYMMLFYVILLSYYVIFHGVIYLFPPSHFRQVDSWDDASGDFVPVLGEEAQGFERLGSREDDK